MDLQQERKIGKQDSTLTGQSDESEYKNERKREQKFYSIIHPREYSPSDQFLLAFLCLLYYLICTLQIMLRKVSVVILKRIQISWFLKGKEGSHFFFERKIKKWCARKHSISAHIFYHFFMLHIKWLDFRQYLSALFKIDLKLLRPWRGCTERFEENRVTRRCTVERK